MENREFSLPQLAEMVQGQLIGDSQMKITGLAPIEAAGVGDITFLAKEKQAKLLEDAKASAVIVPKSMNYNGPLPIIKVRDPYLAAAIIQNRFLEKPFIAKGIHPRACLGEECQLGKEISIGPLVVLGDRVKIGERVAIEAGTVIGDDVVIGDDTHLYANVTIYKDTIIGNRVAIHAGTVIGADGYGYATNERGEHVKRPQVGNVRIDDDVEIGANSCVDRATFGTTWIKAGTKIDNLVMVAHNVVVGENCLLVSQTGIAGSTTLGRNVVMGGQSGTAGHVNIGDQVMVAARGGIHNDQPKGAVIGGAPVLPIRQWAKCSAVYAKLPELQSQVRKNSRAIAKLTGEPENEE